MENSNIEEGFCTNINQYILLKIQSHISLYLTSFNDECPTFIQGERLFINEVLRIDGMLPCLLVNKQEWIDGYLSAINQQYGTAYRLKILLKANDNSLLYYSVAIQHNFDNPLDSMRIIDDFTRTLANEIIKTNLVAIHNEKTKSYEINLDRLMEEMPSS